MATFDETLNYFAVAASQTTLAVGAIGNVGDYIQSITVIPATSAAAAWVLHDGPGTTTTLLSVPAAAGGTGESASTVITAVSTFITNLG